MEEGGDVLRILLGLIDVVIGIFLIGLGISMFCHGYREKPHKPKIIMMQDGSQVIDKLESGQSVTAILSPEGMEIIEPSK